MRPLALLPLLLVLAAAPARAQERDRAAEADALFREAKQLIDKRRFDEACPKLEESQRLDPAGGTALTLALCHQAQGRLATAHAEFGVALGFAERDGRADRAKVARDAIAKLGLAMSRVILRVAPETAELADLVVERDGAPVDRTAIDVPIPVDGGEHTVAASAPGHRRFEQRFTVAARDQVLTVDVPALEPVAPPPAAVAPPAAPPPKRPSPVVVPRDEGSSSTRTAFTIAGFGLAAVGAASTIYFGLRARSTDQEADLRCPSSPCPDKRGVELNADARRDAWIATISAGVAAAGAAVGVVLLLNRPKAAAPRATAWSLSLAGAGATLRRAF